MKRQVTLAVLLALGLMTPGSFSASAEPPGNSFTPPSCDDTSCRSFGDYSVSPDGDWLYAVGYFNPMTQSDTGENLSEIYRFGLSDDSIITLVGKGSCTKHFSEMSVGDSRSCTIDGSMSLSPDGKKLFYLRNTVEHMIAKKVQNQIHWNQKTKLSEVHILNLETQENQILSEKLSLSSCEGSIADITWASDSTGYFIKCNVPRSYTFVKAYVDAQKGTITSLNDSNYFVGISANGQFAVTRAPNGTISLKNLKTKKVTIFKWLKVTNYTEVIPLNDGKNIVYRTDGDKGVLYVGNSAGKQILVSKSAMGKPQVSIDQKTIMFLNLISEDPYQTSYDFAPITLPR